MEIFLAIILTPTTALSEVSGSYPSDLTLKNTKGKLFIYDVLGGTANGGLECKAFKPIQGGYCNIYAEYSNELELFIREKGGNWQMKVGRRSSKRASNPSRNNSTKTIAIAAIVGIAPCSAK